MQIDPEQVKASYRRAFFERRVIYNRFHQYNLMSIKEAVIIWESLWYITISKNRIRKRENKRLSELF